MLLPQKVGAGAPSPVAAGGTPRCSWHYSPPHGAERLEGVPWQPAHMHAMEDAGSGEVTGSHDGAAVGFHLHPSLRPSLLGGKLFFIYCSLGKLCYCKKE